MAFTDAVTASQTAVNTQPRAAIAQNFDAFLGLLTTQLRNQSPLDPLNANEFTQQLVQFAGVEQQLRTNESLTSLLTATKTTAFTGALGLLGATVTADGRSTQLRSGRAEWNLQVPRAVTGAVVTITDSSGNVVFSERRAFSSGEQAYSWNGRTSSGSLAPDGEYTVKVDALDPSGNTVAIGADMRGVVEKVDLSGTEPMITVGNLSLPISKIKTIQRS